jgi:hypothetical protein
MSRSQEVVQTVAPPTPAPSGHAGTIRSRSRSGARLRASAVAKVAWAPREDLGQAEWLAAGRRLGAIGRCSQWWIGDWVRYGAARWGERYAEAARITGYDVATLRNMAWVASRFDLSLRSDKLSWSHHVLLAPLNSGEQRRWLERAAAERLSVADLRLELRVAEAGESSSARRQERQSPSVCPHCGHELPAASS